MDRSGLNPARLASPATKEGLMNSVRQGAAWIYRILITLFAVAVVVEFFLAGLGIFRAMPGEHAPVSHETFSGKFDLHAALGWFLIGGALLLLIVILVAWAGPRLIGATFGLAVLTLVQGILASAGDNAPVAGAFHVINALVILGLSGYLTSQAWRGNLLIPPPSSRGLLHHRSFQPTRAGKPPHRSRLPQHRGEQEDALGDRPGTWPVDGPHRPPRVGAFVAERVAGRDCDSRSTSARLRFLHAGELAEERAAAREAVASLRLSPILFELGARPHPPRGLYRPTWSRVTSSWASTGGAMAWWRRA